MSVNTGNGTTLTVNGSAAVANITSISSPTKAKPALDRSTLDTAVNERKMPSDLASWSEIEIGFFWDDTATPPDLEAAPSSAVLTFPLGDNATAANLTGTAFFTEVTYPTFENNVVQAGSAKLQFDGETGPTYTPASAS